MILVRRRYATHIIVSPLIPALKGRAIIRGRYAAQKLCGMRAGGLRSQDNYIRLIVIFTCFESGMPDA
jgi:hypothetical protein